MPNELVPPSLAAASSRDMCCVVYKTSRTGSSDPPETLLSEITGYYGRNDIFKWGSARAINNQAPSLSNPEVFAVSYDLSGVDRYLFYGKVEGNLLEIHTIKTTSDIWGTPAKLLYSDGTQVMARRDSKIVASVWKRALHLFVVDKDHTLIDIVGTKPVAGGPYSWTRSDVSVAPRILPGSFLALSLKGHFLTVMYQYWDGSLCSSESSYEKWKLRKLLQKKDIDAASPLAITGSRTIFYILTTAGQTSSYARDINIEGDNRIGPAKLIGGHTASYAIPAVNIGAIHDARFLSLSSMDSETRLVERIENAEFEWTMPPGLVITSHPSSDNDRE